MKKYLKPITEIETMMSDENLLQVSAPELSNEYTGGDILERTDEDIIFGGFFNTVPF